MRILVVGSGGREHAIAWALSKTERQLEKIFCAPGNDGIGQIAECVAIDATNVKALAQFAEDQRIDLTVVGGEASLALGIVDAFKSRGLLIAGASSAAARLESSKSFAKDFMARHRIPSAWFNVADSPAEAAEILERGEFGGPDDPVVVKADGLAAGKGVVVARSRREALDAVEALMIGGAVSAEAARRVVIEEALEGREASLLLFSDGKDFVLMPAARDHKRLGENDTGPNTGGMGVVIDANVLDEQTLNTIVRDLVLPTLAGATADGFPFQGILFIGVMLTADGPKVLEYNVRFGDPEAQAILVRLESDLVDLFEATARGGLGSVPVRWSNDASACVVLASRGYPAKPETGSLITGLDRIPKDQNIQVFHAGTKRSENGEWQTAGGRVLGITATGKDLDDALQRCYEAVGLVSWDGMQFRRDIGK
jgi:phosphoribosylamine--glycine ligase